jgi:hypothetical protein
MTNGIFVFALAAIPRSKLRLGIVAASASEWRFVGSLMLAATPEERQRGQMPRGCLPTD